MDEEAIARLREINDEMTEAMAELDSLRFGRLNQEFHGLIYEYCPNTALVAMLSDVSRRLDAIRRTVFVQIPYRGASSVAEHRELIEVIANGAPAAKIEKAARDHKLTTVRSFRALQDERAPQSGSGATGRAARSRS